MALRVCLWITAVAFTAIVPGGVTGILAHARRWPPERCRKVARRGGWVVLLGAGLAAWLLGAHYPYGWVAGADGGSWAIAASLVWIAVAEYAPRLIAHSIAFHGPHH
ncbi:MAG TPA: hypothetical protein VGS58_02965 [Candidatus Sulfopaludibacter sp.]|nr:hypothetical protein [Candidatus Sulfopaludibacter sp.]